jgi:hypothetical protein
MKALTVKMETVTLICKGRQNLIRSEYEKDECTDCEDGDSDTDW